MKTLPSKELLSAVLGRRVYGIEGVENNILTTTCYMMYLEDTVYKFNIDTLARLMKEWALKEGFHIYSKTKEDGGLAEITDSEGGMYLLDAMKRYTANDESEAVTKACEWILKEQS